jgi:hypothetical protein
VAGRGGSEDSIGVTYTLASTASESTTPGASDIIGVSAAAAAGGGSGVDGCAGCRRDVRVAVELDGGGVVELLGTSTRTRGPAGSGPAAAITGSGGPGRCASSPAISSTVSTASAIPVPANTGPTCRFRRWRPR